MVELHVLGHMRGWDLCVLLTGGVLQQDGDDAAEGRAGPQFHAAFNTAIHTLPHGQAVLASNGCISHVHIVVLSPYKQSLAFSFAHARASLILPIMH